MTNQKWKKENELTAHCICAKIAPTTPAKPSALHKITLHEK
jgi:hypothetical protein